MAKKKKETGQIDDHGYLCGMVKCCRCGSTNVRGHNRYGIKSRKVVAVDYNCGQCGNRYVAGSSELSVRNARDIAEDLRRKGFQVGGR
jgi:hypothetical protein